MNTPYFEKYRLFYQSYELLEKELLSMQEFIHFSDENLSVYSVKLLDFIIHCNIEIESLLKEIYKQEKNVDKVEINEAFKFAIAEWKIDKKYILFANQYFYFNDFEITPFAYQNSENKNLTKIYNALKHDRVNNLNKATLEVALNCLGALFILNLYFGYEKYYVLYAEHDKIEGYMNFKSEVFQPSYATIDRILYWAFIEDDVENIEVDDFILYEVYDFDKFEKAEKNINISNENKRLSYLDNQNIKFQESLNEVLSKISKIKKSKKLDLYMKMLEDMPHRMSFDRENPLFDLIYDHYPKVRNLLNKDFCLRNMNDKYEKMFL